MFCKLWHNNCNVTRSAPRKKDYNIITYPLHVNDEINNLLSIYSKSLPHLSTFLYSKTLHNSEWFCAGFVKDVFVGHTLPWQTDVQNVHIFELHFVHSQLYICTLKVCKVSSMRNVALFVWYDDLHSPFVLWWKLVLLWLWTGFSITAVIWGINTVFRLRCCMNVDGK